MGKNTSEATADKRPEPRVQENQRVESGSSANARLQDQVDSLRQNGQDKLTTGSNDNSKNSNSDSQGKSRNAESQNGEKPAHLPGLTLYDAAKGEKASGQSNPDKVKIPGQSKSEDPDLNSTHTDSGPGLGIPPKNDTTADKMQSAAPVHAGEKIPPSKAAEPDINSTHREHVPEFTEIGPSESK